MGLATLVGSPVALVALVRGLHVLAASVAVGGAVLTWALLAGLDRSDPDGRRADRSADGPDGGDRPRSLRARRARAVSIAATYEWLFWGALGVLAATGVGNLGSFAPSLPGGRWGRTLDRKLLAVCALLVGSAARAVLLDRCRRGEIDPRRLRRGYAATALLLGLVVALAEVLAHG